MQKQHAPFILSIWLLVLYLPLLTAQHLPDSTRTALLEEVVITATKTTKGLSQQSIPLTIITKEELTQTGRNRLSDVLASIPNLRIQYNHGAGVQIQGLDPAYTLILIDGEPVIGREAGTLDLARISVDQIERVEIIRGAASSLYGSEALAGVINIITQSPETDTRIHLANQVETHQTLSTHLRTLWQKGKWNAKAEATLYRSKGYEITDSDGIDPTVPPSRDISGGVALGFRQNKHRTTAKFRFGNQSHENVTNLYNQSGTTLYKQEGFRREWSAGLHGEKSWEKFRKLTYRFYAASFGTRLRVVPLHEGTTNQTQYSQSLLKAEFQYDKLWRKYHYFILGIGLSQEQVETDRVLGGQQTRENAFLYAQNDYVGAKIDLTGSLRADHYKGYGFRITPKISGLYKPVSQWRLRASVGSGFKTPTFQQLYMDYNNPIVGYNVFGTTGIQKGLEILAAQNQLLAITTNLQHAEQLAPETAWAFGLGADFLPKKNLTLKVNLFRNEVKNLIETRPVAIKNNGQQVFTYGNLSKIYTQGFEIASQIRAKNGNMDVSYQFLDTADRKVLQQIRDGEIFTTKNGFPKPMSRREYAGLFNRSRHQAQLAYARHISFQNYWPTDRWDFFAHIRIQFQGRYALHDLNGNLVADIAPEFIPAHVLVHLNLHKEISESANARAGIQNLTGYHHLQMPHLSGRIWYVGFELTL